jgi:methylated-DNA-[protein]-cysteine S-methyltransferase
MEMAARGIAENASGSQEHDPCTDHRWREQAKAMVNAIFHDSAVGPLTLVSDGESLVGLHFEGWNPPIGAILELDPVLATTARQLDAYFDGHLTKFDLPLAPMGTPFQHCVWSALRAIPFGETRSYGQLAKAIGKPSAMRAVGAANGRNPIAIVVPCHRVIGADGSLTGFGGGIERKKFLLSLEQGNELRLTG